MATFDANELNVEEGLEYSMNNKEFYVGILDAYLEETAGELQQMDEFATSGDMPSYATLVHAIKSSSRLIGASLLGEEAYDLELRAKEGNTDYIREHHDALKKHVQVVFDCIEAYKEV